LEYPLLLVQQLLEEAARERPNSPFVLFDDAVLTYGVGDKTANRVAHFLISRGIQKGDRVALFLPNIPHFPLAFFGALKAGAIAVTFNPTYTAGELHFLLNDSGARCLFVPDHPKLYATACEALRDTGVETVIYCNVGMYLPLLKRLVGGLLGKIPHAESHAEGHIAFERILADRPTTPPDVKLSPQEDLASIQYTGGTTGAPKGACLTHYNLISNLVNAYEWVRPGEDFAHAQQMVVGGERFLGVLPWYHSYGLIMTLLAAVRLASSVVCVPDPRAGNPPFTEILTLIQKHRATVFNGVPTLFSMLVNHSLIDQFDLHSLKLCGCGAAPLSVELARQFEAKTGAILYEAYGLTETATMAHCNPTTRRDRKLGTLGLPVTSTDALIVDTETGLHELLPGEDGEIAVSGPQVMQGYWQRPDENDKVFREIDGRRYLLTGDIGHVDEEGFFVLSERKKDIVMVGGFKAYPREIEEVLYTHPKVALAAVIGIPDKHMGEALKAYVKLKDGETATKRELIQFCKQHLAGYKVPRIIEFRDKLPLSPIGKVLKRELQKENLGAAEERVEQHPADALP
jgi:long-chain acyl-CoA synthetase